GRPRVKTADEEEELTYVMSEDDILPSDEDEDFVDHSPVKTRVDNMDRDNRGPRQDNRGPRRDNRDNRGPRQDNRGPRNPNQNANQNRPQGGGQQGQNQGRNRPPR